MSTSKKYGSDSPIVETTAEFLEVINDITRPDTTKGSKVLFRGQENENWEIQTSAYRRLRLESNQKKVSKEYEWNYNRGLMEQFKHADFNSRYPSEIMKQDLGVLAQLQHNGAATSLIDFSDNPLVALWFACKKFPENDSENIKNGKVFILYTGSEKNIEEIDIFEPIENYKGISPKKLKHPNKKLFYWKPAHLNKRIAAQQSYFLIDKKEIPAMPEMSWIIIQGDKKNNILEELSSLYGINEIMLFPDFVGFVQANSVHSPYSKEEKHSKNIMSVRYYNKSIKKNSKDFQAYNNRGSAKHELEDYRDAIKDFTKAINLKPKDANAYYNRGNSKHELGNTENKLKYYQGAINDFSKAIKINPDDGHAYYNRGLAKLELGDAKLELKYYQGATYDFTQAHNINPKDANAYYNCGNAKWRLKDYQGAIDEFDKTLEVDPNHVGAKNNRDIADRELRSYRRDISNVYKNIEIDLRKKGSYYNSI